MPPSDDPWKGVRYLGEIHDSVIFEVPTELSQDEAQVIMDRLLKHLRVRQYCDRPASSSEAFVLSAVTVEPHVSNFEPLSAELKAEVAKLTEAATRLEKR